MSREKVGKIARDLLLKTPETRDPIELEREMHKQYESAVFECIDSFKKKYPQDFYIVVLTKKERLMPNVLRHYFTARLSCPTPDYDQAVYKYFYSEEALQFLWVVPSKDTCLLLKENALAVHPSERELLQFVLEFYDGTLLRISKKLNGERDDSPLLVA